MTRPWGVGPGQAIPEIYPHRATWLILYQQRGSTDDSRRKHVFKGRKFLDHAGILFESDKFHV